MANKANKANKEEGNKVNQFGFKIFGFTSLACLALLASLAIITGCGGKKEATSGGGTGKNTKGRLAYPVETALVKSRPVEYRISAVGSVEAFERVHMTARVGGVVEQVLFKEGESVKAGQSLVEIEPNRYRIAVQSAKAAYERTQAARADATAGLKRREDAEKTNPGVIPGEELETWRTKTRTASAEESQAQAALEQAELNLRDAYVKAPVAGIIQSRSVETGQYIQPGAGLALLMRREPLMVRFQVPEGEADRLSQGMPFRFTVRNDAHAYEAKLVHVAESADESTRMVVAVGEVKDARKDRLRPGAFAEVVVPVGSSVSAPVIPQAAIRSSERGFLVYVVDGETAHERVVTLGLGTEGGWVEVKAGLKLGEWLVIRGAEALKDGATVKIVKEKEETKK